MVLKSVIVQKRKALGLSQEELAELSGISVRTIQRIERGKVRPHPYTLRMLAQSLQLNPEELQDSIKQDSTINKRYTKQLLSLSSLGVLVLPISNIILPLILWRKNKASTELHELGRQVVSFQLLWTIFTIILIFLAPILTKAITGSASLGHFPMIGIIYLIALLINVLLSISNTISVTKNEEGIFSKIPVLL